MLPGTTVSLRQASPPRSTPTDIGTWFCTGITQKGPTSPVVVNSIDDYTATFGARVSQGLVYDALDVFFQEGGSKAIVSRVVGPSPVYATVNLLDGSSVISLVATAKYYGSYANGMKVVVTGTGPYTIQVQDSGSNVLETSGSLTTQADALAYGLTSQYINLALGVGSAIPAAGTRTLASGTDDYASAGDTQWLAALNLFTKDLGPGQVSAPGRTTSAAHANLIGHAAAYNRRALLDYADSASRSSLVTAAGTDTALSNSQYAAGFAPWAIAPGVLNNTTRTVPFSAVAAGIIARNDQAGVTPNQPSAGTQYGVSRYILGISQVAWSDADRELLNNAGVNVVMNINGLPTIFGYRSLAPSNVPADWLLFANSRLVMAIVAQAQAIGQGYVFRQIDGRGLLFADFQADLVGMLMPYFNDGSLFGDTPQAAFSVNVGPSVNTAATLAQLKLIAEISLQLSPNAEQVTLQIVTETLTEGVS
jgi:phage tail sheath protein FI